jgi:hypothetical protein
MCCKSFVIMIVVSQRPSPLAVLSPDSARTTSFLYILSGPLHSSLDLYISFTLPSQVSPPPRDGGMRRRSWRLTDIRMVITMNRRVSAVHD